MADLIDRAALLEKLELLAKHEDAFRETVIRGVMFTIRSETAVANAFPNLLIRNGFRAYWRHELPEIEKAWR